MLIPLPGIPVTHQWTWPVPNIPQDSLCITSSLPPSGFANAPALCSPNTLCPYLSPYTHNLIICIIITITVGCPTKPLDCKARNELLEGRELFCLSFYLIQRQSTRLPCKEIHEWMNESYKKQGNVCLKDQLGYRKKRFIWTQKVKLGRQDLTNLQEAFNPRVGDSGY